MPVAFLMPDIPVLQEIIKMSQPYYDGSCLIGSAGISKLILKRTAQFRDDFTTKVFFDGFMTQGGFPYLFAITFGSTAGKTDMRNSRLREFAVQFCQIRFNELSDLSFSLLGKDGHIFELSHLLRGGGCGIAFDRT